MPPRCRGRQVLAHAPDRELRRAQSADERRPLELRERVLAISGLVIDQLRPQQVVLVVEAQRAARQATPLRELSDRQ